MAMFARSVAHVCWSFFSHPHAANAKTNEVGPDRFLQFRSPAFDAVDGSAKNQSNKHVF